MPLTYSSVITNKKYPHCNRVKKAADIDQTNPEMAVVIAFSKVENRCPEIWVIDAMSEGMASINQCYRDLGVPEGMIDIILC